MFLHRRKDENSVRKKVTGGELVGVCGLKVLGLTCTESVDGKEGKTVHEPSEYTIGEQVARVPA